MLLYGELAPWWPLLSPPAEYAEEADFFAKLLHEAGNVRTVLELGSGGGSNAFYLKRDFTMTLVDLSPGMLEVSRALNPDLEHHEGDMRTTRLGRTFDAVFIHDAIMYMTTLEDLRAAIETAAAHSGPGGTLLLAPDDTREIFQPSTDHGGTDDETGRGLRYVEWTYDPDPTDSLITTDFAYLLRDPDGAARVVHDRHVFGLFPRSNWLRLLADAGFDARIVPDPFDRDLFVATKQ